MPLKEVSTPLYLKRTRIFVDSTEKNAERSRTAFDYTFDVAEAIQNVVSIELSEWNISSDLAVSATGRYNTALPNTGNDTTRSIIPGASTFDIELENETNTEKLVIPCNLEILSDDNALTGFIFNGEASLLTALDEAFASGLALNGNTTFSAANTTGEFNVDSSGRLFFVAYRTGTLVPLRSRILFKTGPTSADQASDLMGFEPNVDTPRIASTSTTAGIGSGFNYVTVGSFYYNIQPYRYINVYVDEMQQNFEPVARIYLNRLETPENIRPFNKDHNARLLQEPIRRLDRLSIRLTYDNDDKRIPEMLDTGHQLTFDVLSIAQETEIPEWVQQEIFL